MKIGKQHIYALTIVRCYYIIFHILKNAKKKKNNRKENIRCDMRTKGMVEGSKFTQKKC